MGKSRLPRPAFPAGSRARTALIAVLGAVAVAAITAAAFGPAWHADFVYYDDGLNFLSNEHFRGLSGEHIRWMLTTGRMGHYQPLSWLTLGADYVRAGGLDGPAFHRTNILLHALGAVIFGMLARRLLTGPGAGRGNKNAGRDLAVGLGAMAAALVFSIHPLRVESVAWVTERRDVLSGALFIASLWAWTAGPWRSDVRRFDVTRGVSVALLALAAVALVLGAVDLGEVETLRLRGAARVLLPASVLCIAAASRVANRGTRAHVAFGLIVLSLFAKAWGMVMPALLLVLDFWPHRRGRVIDLVLEKLPFAAVASVFAVLAVWAQSSTYSAVKGLGEYGIKERVLQALYGLAFYPAKTLVPVSLGPLYDLPEKIDPLAPRFLGPALAVMLVTAAAIAVRRRFPAGLAAWVAFGIVVSPVLGFLQSGPQLVAERYSYLSCLPFALLAGGAVARGVHRGGTARRATLIVTALALSALGGLTWRQSSTWTSSRALFAHTVRVRPDHPASWLFRAELKQEEADAATEPGQRAARLGEARDILEEGMTRSRDPKLPKALGAIYGALAEIEPERAAEYQLRALDYMKEAYASALERKQFAPGYRLELGRRLAEAGQPRQALEHLIPFVEQFPDRIDARVVLARALIGTGRAREAETHLRMVTKREPGRAEAWRLLGTAREDLGDPAGAAQAWQRVLALAPGDEVARRRLQEVLRR